MNFCNFSCVNVGSRCFKRSSSSDMVTCELGFTYTMLASFSSSGRSRSNWSRQLKNIFHPSLRTRLTASRAVEAVVDGGGIVVVVGFMGVSRTRRRICVVVGRPSKEGGMADDVDVERIARFFFCVICVLNLDNVYTHRCEIRKKQASEDGEGSHVPLL